MKTFSLQPTFLGISLAFALLAGVSFSFAEELYKDAWCYREQFEQATDRAAEAREKLDKKTERKAIGEQIAALGSYLKHSPDDIEMLERYAMLLAKNFRDAATFELACTTLEQVVEQDPERTEARKKLAGFLMSPPIHRYNDACEHLDYLLQKTPYDSETLTLLGQCQIAMSRSEKAIANLERAIECSAAEVDAYNALAVALRYRLNRPAEADAWMDKMIAANPDSALAQRSMAKYLLAMKKEGLDPKAALQHAELALKLDPDNNESLSLAAECGLVGGNFEAARQYAAKGLENEPESPSFRERMYRILADAECRLKNEKKALEILQKAFAETKNPQLLWQEADMRCNLGDADGAAAAVEKLSALKFNEGGLDYLRGRICLLKSKWREAVKALESALDTFAEKPDTRKRMECWLGVCYGQLGNAERQIAAFRRALQIDPKFEPAQKALAEALARAGEREEAIEAYKKLLESQQAGGKDDPQNLANYIHELLLNDETGEAETNLRKLAEKWPHAAQMVLLRAELLLRRDKTEEALELMKNFVEDSQGTPADRGQRMRLAAQGMEDFAGRLKLADEAVVKDRLLRAAETYFRQYADAHPSAAIVLADFFARQKRFEDAADFLEKNWKNCEPTALSTVCFAVAQGGRGPKEIVERMLMVLHQARKYFQDPAAITLMLGNLHVGAGKYAEAEEFYREVLQKNPNHAVALNNLAALLTMMQKNLPEALELVEKAIKISGPLGQMLDTRACVYLAQGEAGKALADLSEALAEARTAERLFHQAEAYELAGQKQLAAKAMKEALAKGLSEKSLTAREIPIYERLKKMAEELPPAKEDEKPPHNDKFTAISHRQSSFSPEPTATVALGGTAGIRVLRCPHILHLVEIV